VSTQALATVEADSLIQRVAEGRFTPSETAMLHRLVKLRPGQKAPSRDELALVVSEALHLGLDPFAGQCYFISFGDGAWQCYPHWTGLVKIAEDTGDYQGRDPILYSDDGKVWTSAWVPDTPPRFARATVYRRDHRPTQVTVKWVRVNKGTPNWQKDPEGMMAKTALRLAIKEAFPKEAGSLSTLAATAEATVGVESLIDGAPDEPMSDEQRRGIFGRLSEYNMDRSERLRWAGEILGREVDSFSTLTASDATALLEWLGAAVQNTETAGDVGESTVTRPGDSQRATADLEAGTVPPASTPQGRGGDAVATSGAPLVHPSPSPPPEGWVDRRTELTFRIAAAHAAWAKTMPKGAKAWMDGYLAHVNRKDLNECSLEELEAGWDWLVALNRDR